MAPGSSPACERVVEVPCIYIRNVRVCLSRIPPVRRILASTMTTRLSATVDYKGLLDKYDTWLFDCDGVLWQGDRMIEGVPEVLSLLRTHKKRIFFVTNNATKSRKSYKKKFDQLGLEAHVVSGVFAAQSPRAQLYAMN